MYFKTKQLFIAFITLMIVSACKKHDFDIVNLNGNQVSAIGHGGMGADNIYPKNCFESIVNCFSAGADGTELDIQMTKDSVLVIYHDKDLSHSTNKSGEIWDMYWSEIEGARYKFPKLTDYKVIKFETLLENVGNIKSKLLFMDYKKNNPNNSDELNNRIYNAFDRLIKKYDLEDNIRMEFGASQLDLLNLFHTNRPNLHLFIYTKDIDEGIKVGLQYSADGIVMAASAASKEVVNKAHANQLMLGVYGVHNKPDNIEMVEHNVDFIQTDKLKHLIRILK